MHPSCNYTSSDSMPFGVWKVIPNELDRQTHAFNQRMRSRYLSFQMHLLRGKEENIKPQMWLAIQLLKRNWRGGGGD